MHRLNNSASPDRVAALYNALTPEQRVTFNDLFVPYRQPAYEDYAARYALEGDELINLSTKHRIALRGTTTSCAAFSWDGRRKYIKIPRLVALLKVGRLLTEGEHVDHINHDPTDHRPANLRVLTVKENMRYRRGGKMPPGIRVRILKNKVVFYATASEISDRTKIITKLAATLTSPLSVDKVNSAVKETCGQVEDLHMALGYGTKSVYITRNFPIQDWSIDEKVVEKWEQSLSSTPKQPG